MGNAKIGTMPWWLRETLTSLFVFIPDLRIARRTETRKLSRKKERMQKSVPLKKKIQFREKSRQRLRIVFLFINIYNYF